MRRIRLIRLFICVFLLIGVFHQAIGQQKISGRIVDVKSGKGIPASVKIVGTNEGTSCDSTGFFTLSGNLKIPLQVIVSAVGYKETSRIYDNIPSSLEITLEQNEQLIEAVEISRRMKYQNRNPAVDIINQVIKNKKGNRLENQSKLHFQQYDKLLFGLVNPSEKYQKRMGNLAFVFQNIDTTSSPGNRLLPIFMQEQMGDVYAQNDPKDFKKFIKSQKQTKLDERFVNNRNIQSYLSYLFQDVEIYDENIFLINKLFISPIANNAPTFYKYYISDTLNTDEGTFIELIFEPRNKRDLLLSGKLHITMDSRYAVRYAELHANKESNLNWVNEITINLQYRRNKHQYMYLSKSDVNIIFGVKNNDAVYGRKSTINYDHDFTAEFSDTVYKGAPTEISPQAQDNADLIATERPVSLSPVEANVYTNIDSLNDNRTFKTMLAVGYVLSQGFYPFGPIEVGPLEYLYSRNNIEGNRIRLGGRTTAAFSEKLFLEGYVAYGLKDRSAKYFLRPTLSLNGESVVTYPAHYIQAAVQHDIFDPGRNLGFKKGDSFFQSIRSSRPTKWMDTYAYQVKHLIEFGNHLSFQSSFLHHQRRAIGDLSFVSSGDSKLSMPEINTNELEFILRWAPNEKFYYRNLVRSTIVERYPVFNLQYNRGLKGFWGGDYTFDALRASVSKRFFLKQFGFADATLAGGKIWGTLPYPLLELPDVYREEDRHVIDFSMMQGMEFVADEYIRFSFQHQLEGFIFNKIPFIKRLNLREIWGVKMFYGDLSDNNNPYYSDQVIRFDKDKDGQTMTHVMDKSPYWEGSVGIDNILRILRVEYVRRLNYLGLPNVDKDAYRLSIHLNF